MKKLKLSDFTGSNCVPTAIHQLSGKDEDLVLKTCISNGFKSDHGMYMHKAMNALKSLKIKNKVNFIFDSTFATVQRENQEGSYMVELAGHVFPMVNGIPLDICWRSNHKRKKVNALIKIEDCPLEKVLNRTSIDDPDAYIILTFPLMQGSRRHSSVYKMFNQLLIAFNQKETKNKFNAIPGIRAAKLSDILDTGRVTKKELAYIENHHKYFFVK